MIEYKILKKSKKSNARLGIIKTPHGIVETPSLVPVATQATIKTLTADQVKQTKSQILISNTFHLHLKPGEQYIKGKIHEFMNWDKPLMTDSGGYQVFSLGFGRDYQVSKILKERQEDIVKKGKQPKNIKITEDGVFFRSPVDGKKLFIGPKESMKIQKNIGADIIFAFDECTPPMADYEYTKKSLEMTHKWAKICSDTNRKQALYGIVQGSRFKDLREESAQYINSLDFEGYGIGGDLGHNKKTTEQGLSWVIPHLDERKPRHLLGIGYLDDMELIIRNGIDTFDCTVPTHYARHGIAFTSKGKLDLSKTKFLKDIKPIDSKCNCPTCLQYKRNYICHLLKAKEITAMSLLTMHNLYFFNSYVESLREKIKKGLL